MLSFNSMASQLYGRTKSTVIYNIWSRETSIFHSSNQLLTTRYYYSTIYTLVHYHSVHLPLIHTFTIYSTSLMNFLVLPPPHLIEFGPLLLLFCLSIILLSVHLLCPLTTPVRLAKVNTLGILLVCSMGH